MKSILVSSVVAALLVLTGCSDKEPVVEADSAIQEKPVEAVVEKEAVEVEPVQEEMIESETSVITSDSNGIASVEGEFSTVYFDFDKFNIRQDMKSNVSNDVTLANTSASMYTVKLEGNCDEWGSDEYNFALGLKRSNTVKKALIAEGVDANRITMVSYGESNPTCSDKTKDCWAQNRRVDFKLLP